MKPIYFPQSTKVLQRPSNMTEKECSPLHVWSDGEQCVSCWKASFIERLKILFTGKVWLGVKYGATQPPVFVSVSKVFCKSKRLSRIHIWLIELRYMLSNLRTPIKESSYESTTCD